MMSGATPNARGSAPKNEFQLNIISPSVQVQKLSFPAIPTSCTIQQLKQRISESAPTRVEPQRQRLIYRGHVLTQEQRTLGDVFGQETVCR